MRFGLSKDKRRYAPLLRKMLALFLIIVLPMLPVYEKASAVAVAGAEQSETAETQKARLKKDLVILYTNDVHCAVEGDIGYAGLVAYRKQLEADNNHVLLVDAGDSVQGEPIGTVSEGGIPIELMNAASYDVAIPGNHEFDYGMERFFELVDMADFPYVCANFIDLKTNNLVLEPYAIKEIDGVKIAFVGVTTPKTLTSSTPAYFQDADGEFIYGFGQDKTGETVYAAVQKAVDAARAEGASYVIALAHLGITAAFSPWTSTEVIQNTTGIDVMLDGHSHSVVPSERVKNKAGEWTYLSSTGSKLSSMGMLLITKSGSISTGLIEEYENKDADMESVIAKAVEETNENLSTVVAQSTVDLTIAEPGTDVRIIRNAETNLGDLCADAYRAIGGADIAFVNGGGIRVGIPAGDITLGQIIGVHPFGNALTVVEATGQEILDALEMGCRYTPEESGSFLQVSGLTYEINTKIESSVKLDENGLFVGIEGNRRVQNVMVGGETLDPEKTYTLASHDYLLKNEGDGYTIFTDNVILQDAFMLDSQVLINYIKDYLGGVIGEEYKDPYGQERIVAVEE